MPLFFCDVEVLGCLTERSFLYRSIARSAGHSYRHLSSLIVTNPLFLSLLLLLFFHGLGPDACPAIEGLVLCSLSQLLLVGSGRGLVAPYLGDLRVWSKGSSGELPPKPSRKHLGISEGGVYFLCSKVTSLLLGRSIARGSGTRTLLLTISGV